MDSAVVGGGSGVEEVVRCCGVLRTRRQSLERRRAVRLPQTVP